MRLADILQVLRDHRAEISGLGVKSIAVFGSVARDEAREDSDVDVLVEFAVPVGLFEFLRVQFFLEKLLDHSVDLVMRDALKPRIRERVLQEAVYAA